jgi:hypothetical protein
MILVNQHRLDAGGAQLNAKSVFSAFNCFLNAISIQFYSQLLNSGKL